MTYSGPGQGVSVDVGSCRCPGSPHESDEVLLAPKLTVPMGAAAMAVLNGVEPTLGNMQAALTAIYLSPSPAGGVIAWSFVDAKLNPEPITPDNIERFIPWTEGGSDVAEKADELYAGDLFRPLAERQKRRSPPTQTERSTSPKTGSGSRRPKSSGSSSPNGTAGIASVAPVP